MNNAILGGIFAALLISVCGGCETSFQGDAKVADGPQGCVKKCASWNLEFVGMVAMGDYSDGCICHVPVRAGQPVASDDATGGIAASVGVITAMRERERQNHSTFMAH
jgi:hypothetical protein